MLKPVAIALATVLLLFGVISMVSPIPGGTVAIALGLALLICTSKKFTRTIGRLRLQFPQLNTAMTWLEGRAGQRLGNTLRRTRPPHG